MGVNTVQEMEDKKLPPVDNEMLIQIHLLEALREAIEVMRDYQIELEGKRQEIKELENKIKKLENTWER